MTCIKPSSVFNPNQQNIKFYQNSLVAVEGPNMVEKLPLDQIKFPYKQLLRSRIILKPGQTNYVMNHLGLGDNATFLCITTQFNEKSKIEIDNFVQYSYANDLNRTYFFTNMLLLTGNSTHRIQQLYLSNPNLKYSVTLDVMVAVIDDVYSFFDTTPLSNNILFTDLIYTSIETWVPDESITIKDQHDVSIAYLQIPDINTFQRNGKIIVIDDQSLGNIYLDFVDEYNAMQALSILSWITTDPTRIIQSLSPRNDSIAPLITFTNNVHSSSALNPVLVPLTSTSAVEMWANSLSLTSTGGYVTKLNLISHLITSVIDERDGEMIVGNDNIIIKDNLGDELTLIAQTGDYLIEFDIKDIAGNAVNTLLKIHLQVVV